MFEDEAIRVMFGMNEFCKVKVPLSQHLDI